MFLTNIIIVLAVVAVSPNCLAKLLGLKPYLNIEYELVSSDEHFHEVLQMLDIGSVRRSHYINAKTTLTLTWNRKYDLYNLLVQSPSIVHEDIFMVGIIFIIILTYNIQTFKIWRRYIKAYFKRT